MRALDNKIAIVTGAAKGIGLGCARVLGEAGAAVALVDIDQAAAQKAVEELRAEGVQVEAFMTDVSRSDQVNQMVAAAVKSFGQIDIVVNNAGVHDSKGVEQATEADWDRIINTNLKSVFLVTKAALPYLKTTQGSIVNMSSMAGVVGQNSAGAYAASKGGMIAMTKNMALDFAPYGIRVNAVCPGLIDTEMVRETIDVQTIRKYEQSFPIARLGTPKEVAELVLFLASEASNYITGQILTIDGGAMGRGPDI